MAHFDSKDLKLLYSNLTDEQRAKLSWELYVLVGDVSKMIQRGKVRDAMDRYMTTQELHDKKERTKKRLADADDLDSRGRKVGKRKKYASETARRDARNVASRKYYAKLRKQANAGKRLLAPVVDADETSS